MADTFVFNSVYEMFLLPSGANDQTLSGLGNGNITITADLLDGSIAVGDAITGTAPDTAKDASINGGGFYIGTIQVTDALEGLPVTVFVFSSDAAPTVNSTFVLAFDAVAGPTFGDALFTKIGVDEALDAAANVFALINTSAAPVCFGEGTAIATPGGAKAVQDIQIGDLVLSASGKTVPVTWVGRQTVATRFGPADRLLPVRVDAGALGDGLPVRDLTLTADHELLIDGLLINAGALVNGDSIDYVPLSKLGDTYTVYHIETEAHDIILAESTPAETYIDYVGRRSFDNYAEYVALYGEDRTIPEMAYPRVSSSRMLPGHILARLCPSRAA